MGTRITVDQLEQMKTHELADLLANLVLLLRRMPDVECRLLTAHLLGEASLTEQTPQVGAAQTLQPAPLTATELRGKKLAELKELAKERQLPFPSKIKKNELISKLLAMGRTSEQYAIQDV